MKKFTLGVITLLFFLTTLNAQTTLGNMGLEDWRVESSTFGDYDEPNGVWTTGNKTVRLGFPQTTFKTTDAYSGTYAARIYTDLATIPTPPLLTSGTLATGIFETDLTNPLNSLKLGTPFTARPVAFLGYFKYISVNNDSFDIYAIVSKWDAAVKKRVTVGAAMFQDSLSYPSYTKFDIPFVYYSQDIPDTISVVFASSAAGDYFVGGVGSTLFVDEISLDLGNGVEIAMMPEVKVQIYPIPTSGIVTFKFGREINKGKLLIYDLAGKKIHSETNLLRTTNIDVSDLPTGTYYYKLLIDEALMNTGNFIVK